MIKNVVVMQGIPGSGKSTVAKKLCSASLSLRHRIVSADNFHIRNGVYTYDPTRAGEAHAGCLHQFITCLDAQHAELVIVDNTNTTPVEAAPYMAVAAVYGYSAKILRVNYDWELAARRNVHGVPARAVLRMQGNLDRWDAPARWVLEEMDGQ